MKKSRESLTSLNQIKTAIEEKPLEKGILAKNTEEKLIEEAGEEKREETKISKTAPKKGELKAAGISSGKYYEVKKDKKERVKQEGKEKKGVRQHVLGPKDWERVRDEIAREKKEREEINQNIESKELEGKEEKVEELGDFDFMKERLIPKSVLKNTLVSAVNKVEGFLGLKEFWRKKPEPKIEPKKPAEKMSEEEILVRLENARAKERMVAKEIWNAIRNGIDRVVVHGEGKDAELKSKIDLDTEGALDLLNNLSGKKLEALYKTGAFSEIVEKGQESQIPIEPGKVIVYVDVSGSEFGIEKKGSSVIIKIDHHGEGKGELVSATSLMAKVLEAGGKEVPRWMKNFIRFTDNVDNLAYIGEKDKKGNKYFNEREFRQVWPGSLYGIYKELPYKWIRGVFEKNRDPWQPFTDKELAGESKEIFQGEEGEKTRKKISKIIENQSNKVNFTLRGVKNAVEYMKKEGIAGRTEELGSVVYHNIPEITLPSGKRLTNVIPNDMGFLATKALGYDTFAAFNRKNKSFFVNTMEKNIDEVAKRLSEIAPGTQNIRGVMVFPPKDRKGLENMTEEKFLEILKLKKG